MDDATSGAMVWVHNANGYDGWFPVNESMPSAARQFQRQAAGTVNRAYYKNNVKFDGHRKGVLLEAKGLGYSKLLQPGSSTFFPVAKNLMAQAQRQVKAASGQKIQWIVAERDVADKLEQAFRIKRWPIEVIHRKILW